LRIKEKLVEILQRKRVPDSDGFKLAQLTSWLELGKFFPARLETDPPARLNSRAGKKMAIFFDIFIYRFLWIF